jgi:hypothetical protein
MLLERSSFQLHLYSVTVPLRQSSTGPTVSPSRFNSHSRWRLICKLQYCAISSLENFLSPVVVLGHVRVTGNADPRRSRFVVPSNPYRCCTAPDTPFFSMLCTPYGGNHFRAGNPVRHSAISNVPPSHWRPRSHTTSS